MLHKLTLLLVGLLVGTGLAYAQDVQWASKVIDVSSELSPNEYGARQILGKPDVLPQGGDSPSAWLPEEKDLDAYIKVGFENPIKAQQIAIGESFNPSAVFKVFAYDTDGKEYLINTFDPEAITRSSRMLNVFFNMTDYEVAAVKVLLNNRKVRGPSTIDAIGISPSRTPITAEIKVLAGVEPGLQAERLSDNVNSEYRELKPLISPDGNTLYFSRQYHPDNVGGKNDREDIWYSERDPETGEWKPAKNMGAPLNTKGPDFVSSLTPDGNSVIMMLGNQYTRSGKKKAGVSFATKNDDGTWNEPTNINIKNDINLSDKANYFMANNRQVIIMSVERDDTKGARDLYVSFKEEDGDDWSEPLNIGNDINTAGTESSPFLAADDKTLYFSSDGLPGYGDADIFVSRRLDDTWTNWTEPENLGEDINSDGEDIFFNIPLSGDYAYYSRGVKDGEDADVYRLELPPFFSPTPVVVVKGVVYNAKTNEPLPQATVIYERLEDGRKIGQAQIDPQTGEYQIALPYGATYGYLAEADSFLALSANIDLKKQEEYKELEQDLYLMPVDKKTIQDALADADTDGDGEPDDDGETAGVSITLNNIFFDFDKSRLRSTSYSELNRLSSFMKDNNTAEVEIAGHTDNVGSDAYNKSLSGRRAQSVVDYLVSKGVSRDRLKVRAAGESRPIATNETEEGRQENRRVEFKIVGI